MCATLFLVSYRASAFAYAACPVQMPTLKNIIYTEEKVAPADRLSKPAASGVSVYSFDEVVQLGETKPLDFQPPKAKRYSLRPASTSPYPSSPLLLALPPPPSPAAAASLTCWRA